MDNKENKDLASSNEDKEFVYSAGMEANDINGENVSDDDFKFVQQDKSIHDVKFNTKPTTFMKDAMKRFTKNRSSVVGGVILGVLFLLALILPVGMTGVDISQKHDLETHLPMKLLPAGTGFWDGTKLSKNEIYPYKTDDEGNDVLDEDGNLIFDEYDTYPDPSVIVSVSNKHCVYDSTAEVGAQGGFAKLSVTDRDTGIMYNYAYDGFDFATRDYTLTYSLGKLENDATASNNSVDEYSLIMVVNNSATYLINDGMTTDYGTAETRPEGASITPYSTITVNLSDAIKKETSKNFNTDEKLNNLKGKKISFGLAFKKKNPAGNSLYVKSFRITAKAKEGATAVKAFENSNLNARSFGSDENFSAADATVVDANDMVLHEKTVNGNDDPSYWTKQMDGRFVAVDTFVVRADVNFDWYLVTYGLKNDQTVTQEKLVAWRDAGYVTWDDGGKTKDLDVLEALYKKPSSFQVTDKGKENNDVYVTKIQNITKNDSNERIVYNITCQAMMYKYLGYDSIPLHLFGTDYQGKDMLKYVFSGLRTSLILGIVVSLINIIIGVIWGSISGYYGGVVDLTMERITDILGGIPYIVLMTVLTIKMGATFFVFALSLCLTGWIGTASTTRSQFYRYRGREYVLAAKTLGARSPRLIFRHILPNAVGTIVTRSVLMIPSTIFSEATIAYLGLGLTNLDSLGVILSKNQGFLSTYSYELIFPAIIISLLMICFNLFGNGLRDAFNPSLKGED